jgi:hypothetical protein
MSFSEWFARFLNAAGRSGSLAEPAISVTTSDGGAGSKMEDENRTNERGRSHTPAQNEGRDQASGGESHKDPPKQRNAGAEDV